MSARIAFLRHGPTDWNARHRLQGATDIGLGDDGRREVMDWTLPEPMARWPRYTSPLGRALETAALIEPVAKFRATDALREMSFGSWEGRTLDELRRDDPEGLRASESLGLDMTPPGGESPRQVMDRLRPWLREVAADGIDVVAIAHKGVVRVVLAIATGWDMRSRQPVKLDWRALHVFRVDDAGGLAIDTLNVPLLGAAT